MLQQSNQCCNHATNVATVHLAVSGIVSNYCCMSDVWALMLPHSSTFQGHIPMHSLLIFQGVIQGWPIKPVTKLDSVNQQLLNFNSEPASRSDVQTGSMFQI